jgi:hypothetical protein
MIITLATNKNSLKKTLPGRFISSRTRSPNMVYKIKDSALYFACSTNGGMRFNFNYRRGSPSNHLPMQCREGREGGSICPFFCFSLAGMKFLFPKLVGINFFFSKEFYNWREALPDKVLATTQSQAHWQRACQKFHLISTGFELKNLFWKS